MLDFFRRYQRYFFLVVTVVIIISFSFFGTYSTLGESNYHDQIAFTAVDGTNIKRTELDQMVLFLGTDAEDKLLFGGAAGPNFLNDGVMVKDILQKGLALPIMSQYGKEIAPDLEIRLEKEKRYQPYAHPQVKFLSMESAWEYLAPEIKTHFDKLRESVSPTSQEALNARINLYLSQKKFPPQAMRQVLLYQQKQYNWIQPDPSIEQRDFFPFGYHTVEDWLGPKFMRVAAQFIINSAKIAEQKGYKVTKQEALVDLMRNSQFSFQQNMSNPNLGVATSSEYFTGQLQRMGLDAGGAANIWRQILLFRRLFGEEGNSVFVDPITFEKLNEYSKETVEGDLYRLPPELRFANMHDMHLFEIYLNAISPRKENGKDLLEIPQKFHSPAEMAKIKPELVQKRYLLDIAKVDKNLLQAKVSVKEMWKWEIDHWDELKKLFAELGSKKGDSREERFAVLDSLDDKTRSKIDSFARKQMVESHPEWLENALQEATPERGTFGIKLSGGRTPFIGLEDRAAFLKLLDSSNLNEQDPKLAHYTADSIHYYRIMVVDRSPKLEIVTFSEAQKDGSLSTLLDKELEKFYAEVREKTPQNFQNEDKSFKKLGEVRESLEDLYFAKLHQAIQEDKNNTEGSIAPREILRELIASLRLNAFMRQELEKVKTELTSPLELEIKATHDKLTKRDALFEQWKLLRTSFHYERGQEKSEVNLDEAFAASPGSFSRVHTPASGDIFFFKLVKKGTDADSKALAAAVQKAKALLAEEAEQILAGRLLQEMKAKKAISLEYLNRPEVEREASQIEPEVLGS